jgi:hypothetical protein
LRRFAAALRTSFQHTLLRTASRRRISIRRHEKTPENVSAAFDADENCCCADSSAPRVFLKNETVKIEKHTARILSLPAVEFAAAAPRVSVKTIHRAAPFYLSDSFYNLSPGRAPPRP